MTSSDNVAGAARAVSVSGHRFEFLGAPVDPLTLEQAVDRVRAAVASRGFAQHASVNAAKLVRLQREPELLRAIKECEIVTLDGQPVVWAARLLGYRVPERVAGIDLMEELLGLAVREKYRVYLLGARAEVIERAAEATRKQFPGIAVVGWHHGYYTPAEEPGVVAKVAESKPDLLFVALETPAKELFLARNRGQLQVPFAMGVGGAFDILAGRRRRAPGWAQRAGLEWLYRLAQEPRRLARRYLVGNTRFVMLVARELVRRR